MLTDDKGSTPHVVTVAFMGAPGVLGEMLVSGSEIPDAYQCMRDLYDVGAIDDQGNLGNTGNLFNAMQNYTKHKDKLLLHQKLKCDVLPIYSEEAIIKKEGSLAYIDDYNPKKRGGEKIDVAALMCFESAGFNCLEPLANGAKIGLPIADCDMVGRAVAKLQVILQRQHEACQ